MEKPLQDANSLIESSKKKKYIISNLQNLLPTLTLCNLYKFFFPHILQVFQINFVGDVPSEISGANNIGSRKPTEKISKPWLFTRILTQGLVTMCKIDENISNGKTITGYK